MIEGDTLTEVEVNSDWEASSGHGVELTVHLASGRHLFVIRTDVGSTEAEVQRWREERLGQQVARAKELTRWPLGTGGEQVTLQIALEDGFAFEGDLVVGAEPVEDEELETEWVFEGTPGTEMGEQQERS